VSAHSSGAGWSRAARLELPGAGYQAHTILLVDLLLHVEVDASNDEVGNHVKGADGIEDIGVIEGDLLGDLHKPPAPSLVFNQESKRLIETYRMMTRLELHGG
jgi:hypothetical protein